MFSVHKPMKQLLEEAEEVTSGKVKYRKIANGTCYHKETPMNVISVLEWARSQGIRIMLSYGDKKTGKDWRERYDIIGYVGRSTGRIKIPILIYNTRSIGGPGIRDQCIVKIVTSKGKEVLYKHPTYHVDITELFEERL